MKQIKSYMFEAGDTLYYVDKQGEVYSFEVTEDMLDPNQKCLQPLLMIMFLNHMLQ